MSGILRIENLNKGTTLKQGDKTVLSYRLSDADGEQLDIAGKTAVARLMHPDFTRIGYESEALTVSADNIVQFSIDSIIPSRLYYLEITVDGQYIFPSRSDEGKLSIDRSSMGAEITIIENAGIDTVVRKAVDLINEDPSLIIDEDKLISEIIANTTVGSIEEYYQEYRDAIKEYADLKPKALNAISKSQNALDVANGIDAKATNAFNLSTSADTLSKSVQEQFNQVVIDGDSSVESAQARVGADGEVNATLKARLDKEHNEVTTQLTQTVKHGENESVTKSMLSQDIKEDLNSGEIEFKLNMSEIEDGSVSLPKINNPFGILPESVELTRESDITRARSPEVYLQRGDTVYATDDTSMAISTSVDGEITGAVHSGWVKEHTFSEDGSYIIRARFDDSRSLVSTIENLKSKFYIVTKDTAVKKHELDDFKKEIVDEGLLPIPIEKGSISAVTGGNSEETHYRSRSVSFIDFPAGSTVRLLNTEDFDMGVYVEGSSSFVNFWNTVNYTSNKDERIRLAFRKDDSSGITDEELKELEKSFEVITPDSFVRHRQITTSNNDGEIVRYVTLGGNDSNNGGSAGSAYATLQKAFDDNPRVVYIERGIYYGQSATISNARDLTILPLEMNEYISGTPPQAIEFRGSDLLDSWETYNGIYRTSYSGNTRYDQVFISKTLDAEQGRSYNAPLWETIDKEDDYLLKPVFTIAEVEAEQGTFHYDGTHIYMNPLSIDNEFHAVALDSLINISGDSVKLVDFNASFCRYSPLNLDNIKHLTAHNCETKYSYMSDGFSLDYTNGTLTDCRAIKNINDGFNMHYYGDTTLINCSGINNFDDGVSHHGHCTGVIMGGVWRGNAKGGISPVNYAQVNTYNALIEGNGYGIYNIGIDNTVTNISQGNVLKDNGARFRNSNAVLLSLNDTSINNGDDTGQTPVTEY